MFVKDLLLFPSGGRSNYRIPSLVAAKDGTVFAFCNDRKDSLLDHAEEVALVCARKRPGKDRWSEVITLAGIPGWSCMIGSAVYDQETDTVFCSADRNPLARKEFAVFSPGELADLEQQALRKARELGIQKGPFLVYSSDGGETWQQRPHVIGTRAFVRPYDGKEIRIGGSCHGSGHGIQLRHGEHAGRLLCPSRVAMDQYDTWEALRTHSYNNSIFSDDHGITWHASAPVQAGTGEGTLMEGPDGSILYNSRAYFSDQKRYLATSTDGGETYGQFRTDDFLLEEEALGCNASLLRLEREDLSESQCRLLPEGADSITIFINPRARIRENLTACISFDSGATWAKTRELWKAACAYSSLDYCAADGHFYLLYERGDRGPYEHGIALREFDLEWLLKG